MKPVDNFGLSTGFVKGLVEQGQLGLGSGPVAPTPAIRRRIADRKYTPMPRSNGTSFLAVEAESSVEPPVLRPASQRGSARAGRNRDAGDKGTSRRQGRRDGSTSEGFVGHPDAVQLRARRNPRLLALGILLACLGGLGAALLWQETAHSVTVVVMARKVTAGQRITGSDITTTTIGSAPGIASVPAAEMSGLVGKSALFDLAPGALLAPGQIGDLVLPVNDTEVGLKLDRGRAPGDRKSVV